MQGLSFSSVKKHPALIPLYACMIVGGLGAFFYTLRLALRNPDVSWTNKRIGDSNEYYREKQYKFYSPTHDYSKMKSPAPKY